MYLKMSNYYLLICSAVEMVDDDSGEYRELEHMGKGKYSSVNHWVPY